MDKLFRFTGACRHHHAMDGRQVRDISTLSSAPYRRCSMATSLGWLSFWSGHVHFGDEQPPDDFSSQSVDHPLLVARLAADSPLGVVAAHQATASEVGEGI